MAHWSQVIGKHSTLKELPEVCKLKNHSNPAYS